MAHKVLFVDDEPNMTKALKRTLRQEPYEFLSAESAEAALGIFENQKVDVVVSDEQMPGMSGSEFLTLVYKRFPDTIRMILTGQASLEAAIRAINEGKIYRFFTKPCNNIDLAVTIRQALREKDLIEESRELLRVSRQQSALLQGIKKEDLNIHDLNTDSTGRIIVDDEQDYDFDTLIEEINREVRKTKSLLSSSLGQRKK